MPTRLNSQSLKNKFVFGNPSEEVSRLPLEKIFDRPSSIRTLKESHVLDLAESIAVIDLIQPLVVDLDGNLLAGAHRKAAIALLQDLAAGTQNELTDALQRRLDELEGFDGYSQALFDNQFSEGVPVFVRPFRVSDNERLAVDIEISENEKRSQFTKEEVKAIAGRLRELGYSDKAGRPKRGEKRLRPALSAIVGKGLKQVQRYLNEEEETRSSVQVSERDRLITKTIKNLKELQSRMGSKSINAKTKDLILELERLLG